MDGYERAAGAGVRWWARPDFLPRIRNGPFADLRAAMATATLIKDLRAKRTLELEDGPATWIIKVYKPGSIWKRMAGLVRGTLARHELEQCRRVLARGLPTVPVEAAAEWSGGSAVIFRKLEGWTSLEARLLHHRDPALLRRYGAFARRLHEAGVDQDDFNPSNVLLRDGEFRLIDFERMRVRPSVPRARRLALIAKFIRLRSIGHGGLAPFLEGYLADGEDRTAVGAHILALAERQALRDRDRLRRSSLSENRNFGRFRTDRHDGHYRKFRTADRTDGITLDQARSLSPPYAGFSTSSCDDAVRAWQEANVLALQGGPVPVAALRERGRRSGCIVFRHPSP